MVVSGRSLDALKNWKRKQIILRECSLDVSKGEDIDLTLAKVLKFFGTLDILIYAAGIYERGPFGILSNKRIERYADG